MEDLNEEVHEFVASANVRTAHSATCHKGEIARDGPGAPVKCAGVILAGGHSRRFGRDKALAPFGGAFLITRSVNALKPAADILALSGPPALAAVIDLPPVGDFPRAPSGPLAGLMGALAWAAAEDCSHVLTAPCDTPFLPADMAQRLRKAGETVAVVAARAERPHPLCAIWRTDQLGHLARLATDDHPPIRALVDLLGGTWLDFPSEPDFMNINTKEDFQIAKARLSR